MESEIRRLRSTLAISGIAYIAFGFWFIVKAALLLVISPDQLRARTAELFDISLDNDTYFYAALIIMFIFMAIGFAVRLYVGLSALLESRRRQCGIFYVIVAGVVATSGIVATIQAIVHFTFLRALFGDYIPGIADFISLIALIDLTIAAIRLKRITRTMERQR